jgi:hypothetical protein
VADAHAQEWRGQCQVRAVHAVRVTGQEPADRRDHRQDDADEGAARRAELRRVEGHRHQHGQGRAQGLAEEGDHQELVRGQRQYQRQEACEHDRHAHEQQRLAIVLEIAQRERADDDEPCFLCLLRQASVFLLFCSFGAQEIA